MSSQVSVCPQSFTARPRYGAVGKHPTGMLSCFFGPGLGLGDNKTLSDKIDLHCKISRHHH